MLPQHVTRVLVAGASGSGKTTLAARISAGTGIPHTEIDALHWRAGWTVNERFEEQVADLVAGPSWVTELQYRQVLHRLAERAELLVWLRPPRAVVLLRVVRRTLRRRLRRELLWGVNLEPPLRTILTDRDHIIRWSLRSHRMTQERIRLVRSLNPAIALVQVRAQRDVARLLRLLGSEPS